FVDLDQSLLSDQGAHEIALPRIAGTKSRRRDARRLIRKLGTQIFVIIPDFAVVIDCQWINYIGENLRGAGIADERERRRCARGREGIVTTPKIVLQIVEK